MLPTRTSLRRLHLNTSTNLVPCQNAASEFKQLACLRRPTIPLPDYYNGSIPVRQTLRASRHHPCLSFSTKCSLGLSGDPRHAITR